MHRQAERNAGRSAQWLGSALLLVIGVCAFLAPLIAPADPFALDGPVLQAPSAAFPMGTDDLGRDVFSAVVHGARASSVMALGSATLIGLVGIAVGIVSGYLGRWVDDGLMRLTELVQVLPRFFLAIVVVALFGPGLDRIIVVLGITSWPPLARIVRAEVLSMRSQEYIDSARALGARTGRILWYHLLPGVVPGAAAYLSLAVAQVLLIEASLGFIGLSDPTVMSWGLLVGNARDFIRSAWWLAMFPGAAIAIAVLGLNLVADGVVARLTRRGGSGVAVSTRSSHSAA
ncbi:ABC transporter permease [soil metagenome]